MAGQEESGAQLGLMQAMLDRLDSIAEQVRITNNRVDALQVQGTATAQSTCNDNGVTMLSYTGALAKTKMLVHTNERSSKVS